MLSLRNANWDPFREMRSMERQMQRLFNDVLPSSSSEAGPGFWRPHVDIRENDKNILVHAELPGVKQEDINIDVHEGVLTLSGERKEEKKEEKERYHLVERRWGKFQRSFALPEGVDESNINATFDNGVLELTIPKPEQKRREKKKIDIKSSNTMSTKQGQGQQQQQQGGNRPMKEGIDQISGSKDYPGYEDPNLAETPLKEPNAPLTQSETGTSGGEHRVLSTGHVLKSTHNEAKGEKNVNPPESSDVLDEVARVATPAK